MEINQKILKSASAKNAVIHKKAKDELIERERINICKRAVKKNDTRIYYERILGEELDQQNEEEERLKQKKADEEKAARELALAQDEKFAQIKFRQQLRENNPELRDLEAKLRAAYVAKEVSAQLAEKEYLKMQAEIEERKRNELIRASLEDNAIIERKAAENVFRKKCEYRKELHDQLIAKYQEKQFKYEEFLREKKMLDDIIQQMHDDNERQVEERMLSMKKNKADIDTFKQARKLWREKERKEIETENKRLQQFVNIEEQRVEAEKRRKMDREAAKAKIVQEISTKIFVQEQKRKEREKLVQDLLEEELKERDIEQKKMDIRRQLEQKLELKHTLLHQIEEQKERLRREEADENLYKQQMLEDMIESRKLEQLSDAKRRRKIIELRREIDEHIKERRVRRAEEVRQMYHIQEQEKFEEAARRKIIEDERLRILREHAANLIGFMPPGVLRADDLARLEFDIPVHTPK